MARPAPCDRLTGRRCAQRQRAGDKSVILRKRQQGRRPPIGPDVRTLPAIGLDLFRRDGPNQRWSLGFVSVSLICGRRFRILCVVDDYTRECLALVADTPLSGARVARELTSLMGSRGKPHTVVSDNVLCWEAAAGGQQVSLRRA